MPGVLTISLSAQAQGVLRKLGLKDEVLRGMADALDLENDFTVSHIQQAYMSFPKDGPTVEIGLRAVSHRLRGSVARVDTEVSGTTLHSAIGSNVKYAAIHEFGGATKPHTIRAKGKALAFQIGDRMIFRKSVKHPGSTLPARAPFQRGIKDRLKDYSQSLSAAVLAAWNQ